jgi:hypothetical protein
MEDAFTYGDAHIRASTDAMYRASADIRGTVQSLSHEVNEHYQNGMSFHGLG